MHQIYWLLKFSFSYTGTSNHTHENNNCHLASQGATMAEQPSETRICQFIPRHVQMHTGSFVLCPICTVCLGTRCACTQISKYAQHCLPDQWRWVNHQFKLSSSSPVYSCKQSHWLTQQLKNQHFNRLICQRYWCSQKPVAVKMSSVTICNLELMIKSSTYYFVKTHIVIKDCRHQLDTKSEGSKFTSVLSFPEWIASCNDSLGSGYIHLF